jgi:hypothetical protein
MNILPQPWILGAHSPPWSIGGRGARSASFLRLQPALSRFSCQPLSPQPRAVFMEGFLCPFVIGHRLLSFDLPGRFPKFKFSALPASSILLDHDCRLPHHYSGKHQRPGPVPFKRPQTPCRAAAGLSSNVVRCTGPLLSYDPQRREGTAERTGASSDACDLSFEGRCSFDDRRTFSDEGTQALVFFFGPSPRLIPESTA